jgi:hypothetical protein
MGRLWDFHNGWAFFVNDINELVFFATGFPVDDPSQFARVTCPDLTDWTFIAVTYDAAAGSPQVHFYAGNSPDNLVEIGSATRTGGFGELGVHGIMIGNVSFGYLLGTYPLNGWNGSIDQPGIWYGALTLVQLKEAMTCGTRVAPGSIKWIVDIDGVTTEPSIGISLVDGGSWLVDGTEVIVGPNVGCDYVPTGDRILIPFNFWRFGLFAGTQPVVPPPPVYPPGAPPPEDGGDDELQSYGCYDIV